MLARTARQSHGRFLVEPQNKGRAGTWWEPSHEWRLIEATPSLLALQWFTTKLLGYSVEPQNRGRRLDEGVRSPRLVQPPRRGSQTLGRSNRPGGVVGLPGSQPPRSFKAEDMQHDRKSSIGVMQACGGCASVR
jgi:hypothetical protein